MFSVFDLFLIGRTREHFIKMWASLGTCARDVAFASIYGEIFRTGGIAYSHYEGVELFSIFDVSSYIDVIFSFEEETWISNSNYEGLDRVSVQIKIFLRSCAGIPATWLNFSFDAAAFHTKNSALYKLYCYAYLKISWANQKIKIMLHVFQYGEEGGGWLGIFPSPKAYIGGGCLPLWIYVLGAHGLCLGKSPLLTLALLRLTPVS